MNEPTHFPAAQTPNAAFRQRALGEVRAVFARAGERSEAARVFETGGLRLRFPRAGAECEAVIVNTGGGMAGGDRASVDLTVGPQRARRRHDPVGRENLSLGGRGGSH